MASARTVWVLPCVLAALSGCAGSGPTFSSRTSVGSLKASVSHLEYENQHLRRQVAGLERESREIEARLVDEESANGDLQARLDDARTLLGQRGGSVATTDPDPVPGAPSRALPAGRASRKARKPPFAQIPGRVEPGPPSTQDENPSPDPASPPTGWRVEPGSRVGRDESTVWLPVARGTTEVSQPRR